MIGPGVGVCPCGSGCAYDACCGPLHDGAAAPTAVALMRARYSAYALGRSDYVFRTWHPRTRPADVATSPEPMWAGLTVLRTVDGGDTDERGLVEFEASFTAGQARGVLRETSRFVRRRGAWVYVDGDVAEGS